MSRTFLNGLALRNFRGIGDQLVRLYPFRAMNFFIGPNNAGKSTILHFLYQYLDPRRRAKSHEPWLHKYEPLDVRLGRDSSQVEFALAVPREAAIATAKKSLGPGFFSSIERVFEALSIGGAVWLTPTAGGRQLSITLPDSDALTKAISPHEWRQLWHELTHQSGGAFEQHWMPETLANLSRMLTVTLPPVRFVPAIREISEAGSEFVDYSGRGLIDQLAELQNPDHNQREKHNKFQIINGFLAEVTGVPKARIEVPHDRRHLLVHMDGRVLPLSSLGTGIHEVIMLAAFSTLTENEIVCIEEPEIHLHPLLQRKLIGYLARNTKNQYFIATHSASLLNAAEAAVYSVHNVAGETSVELAKTPEDRFEICRRLGYQASDLLQTNFVLWVEGPSDRIYVNHWIRAIASDLVEGIDYSVMFYGGRLLSHLSADDPEVTEFISLRRLNRNVYILMDSDRETSRGAIGATKRRIESELGPSFAWLTAGREIENYVPVAQIEAALKAIYPKRFGSLAGVGRYDHRLHFRDPRGRVVTAVDKVKIAQIIANEPAELGELDLKRRITQLVGAIRRASSPGYLVTK